MREDKKCCGFNTRNERVTFMAVITFAYPVFMLSALSLPLCISLEWLTKINFTCRATGALRAALKLINYKLTVSFRRTIAAVLFRYSPWAAGLFYKYLNILLLTILWAIATCLVRFFL